MSEKFYITTAIAYASSKPHFGNEYEIIMTDAVARYKRQRGYDVFFCTGTDEHGQKIENKAAEAGISPKEFVDGVTGQIKEHTGDIPAATKACKVVDECVGKIADKCKEFGITMLLTADHGNAETMVDEVTNKPQTAHTTNEVPFVIINGPKNIELKADGALCNVAPTVLQLMGIEQPKEMDCESLIK